MLIFHCDVSLPDGMKRDDICLHDEVWIQFEFQGELLKNRRTLVEASLPPNPKRYSAPVSEDNTCKSVAFLFTFVVFPCFSDRIQLCSKPLHPSLSNMVTSFAVANSQGIATTSRLVFEPTIPWR